MQLTYPKFIAWKISLQGKYSPLELLSEKNAKKIQKSLQALHETPFSFQRKKVDEDFLKNFIPLYEEGIRALPNGVLHDLRKGIAAKNHLGFCEAIALYEQQKLLGAQIFRIRKDSISILYRMFPKKLSLPLHTTIGLIASYHLYQYALELGKPEITHGRDRNVFGPNAAIGLASYKLESGAHPFVSNNPDNEIYRDLTPLAEDALVFLGSEKGAPIEKAILFSSSENIKEKYGYLLAHFPVEVVKQG